ncbi:MAG TPA: potassium channel family protein [Candidatus Angelobacter sp.]
MLDALAITTGAILVFAVLWETFETIVLPRRVTRHFRMTRLFYRSSWKPWAMMASHRPAKKRDSLLSYYGPISLLLLLGLWALGLMLGFALIHYGAHTQLVGAVFPNRFGNDLYVSGTTLVTLGLGDLAPASSLGRFLIVLEAGIGFGFLALVIGYLPVLYQAFSRREVTISLLDARAGSPPTAAELLRRHAGPHGADALLQLLKDWEHWSADLMESHLSYPVLAYFRSQHDNQSWLGSLTTILDVCALTMVGVDGMCEYQARMTFAIARHALVDLSQIFASAPVLSTFFDRLPPELLERLRRHLRENGFILTEGSEADEHLAHLRSLYEPYAIALSRYLWMDLPPWIKDGVIKDNWKTTAWKPSAAALAEASVAHEEHF